jgi:hypothetical protein
MAVTEIDPSLPGDGVNVTEQIPAESTQLAPGANDPAEAPKVTVPDGVRGDPVPVASETTAVQVVDEFTGTVDWSQLTEVVLSLCTTSNTVEAELDEWLPSP